MNTRLQTHILAVPMQDIIPATSGLLQRRYAFRSICTSCQTEHGGRRKPLILQRSSLDHNNPSEIQPIVHKVLHSPGQPLDSTTHAIMKSRFRHDFSKVRVHTDAKAAESAQAVNARAFTVGQNMVFGNGQYAPRTPEGNKLLVHELTHVIQQRNLESTLPQQQIRVAPAHNPFEQEATTYAAAGKENPEISSTLPEPALQRITLGESIIRFFGGGTFSDEELQEYLRFLDEKDIIEDHFDSDNKAREVVNHWKRGDSLYILPVRRKILLIEEMLSGFTGDDDERAILDLLHGSTDAEFSWILSTIDQQRLESNFHGNERVELDSLLKARQAQTTERKKKKETSPKVFPAETILELQKRFTSNAESTNRLNCILIIRELAPQLFNQDPELAQRAVTQLGRLREKDIKMTEFGRVLSELGATSNYAEIRFDNGNGHREPKTMQGSAWDTIIEMIGGIQGWHIFGMAVFNGYHSVTVLVDNRPDGPRVYWADQWRINPGEDFDQELGSVSGFRRYARTEFDSFINEYTNTRWNKVFAEGKRWKASLHIWKFRSSLQSLP